MSVKALLKPTLILTAICLVVTAALSVTNFFTQDKIAAAKAETVAAAMERLVPGAAFQELQEGVYEASTGAYVFLTSQMGYKSEIQVMTAVDRSGTVTGVTVVDCSEESPGIGQKVGTDMDFIEQFSGQSKQVQADAITGATFSSDAVTKAVNDALILFADLKGGQ